VRYNYQNNTLSFSFTAIGDFYASKFKYKLQSIDNQWMESENGYAHYSNLKPGTFSLYIRAANQNEVWTAAQKAISIKILPPFWKTWWFYLFCVLLVSTSIYGLYLYRIKQIEKQLLFKQKVIESEMKALRAQMNPHFIFNSLNSINAFILANKSTLAAQYLTKFAQLIRQILDYSAKDIISLEQGIDFLENYLQIESLRLNNKLSYVIDISPEIDTFETEIPSLALQPFVENAIWHGISKRPEGGKVSILIQRRAKDLSVEVIDNGVGRVAASRTSGQSHQSKGLQITSERLALYAEKYQKRVELQTHDLYEADKPIGTKVVLLISPKNTQVST
jgi:hypothetical protein